MAPTPPATTTKAKGKRKAQLSASEKNSSARNVRRKTDAAADISTLHDLDKQLSYRIRILLAVNADQPVYNETISDIIDLSLPASAYGKQVTDSILASLKENGATEEQIHTANEKLRESLQSKTGQYLAEGLNSVEKLRTAITELIGTAQARHGLVLDPSIAKKVERVFVGTKRGKTKKEKDNHVNQDAATAPQERQASNGQLPASLAHPSPLNPTTVPQGHPGPAAEDLRTHHAAGETTNGLQGSGWQTSTASINDPFAFYRMNGYALIRQDLTHNATEDDIEAEILQRWADLTKEERGQWRESFRAYQRQKQGRDRIHSSTDVLPQESRFHEDRPHVTSTRHRERSRYDEMRKSQIGFIEDPHREPAPAVADDTHRAVNQVHQHPVSVQEKHKARVKLEHVETTSSTSNPPRPPPIELPRQSTQILDLLVDQRPDIRPMSFDADLDRRRDIVREIILALDQRLAQAGLTANEGKCGKYAERNTRLVGSGMANILYGAWRIFPTGLDPKSFVVDSRVEEKLQSFALKYRLAFPDITTLDSYEQEQEHPTRPRR